MAGRNTKLTPELIEEIAGKIQSGAWDYVAAESSGISRSTFYAWLQQAQEGTDDPLTLEFSDKVAGARAAARQNAEARVYNEDPFKWLRYGPGRQRPDGDGWTSESTVSLQGDASAVTLQWGNNDDGTEDTDG